jgi:hypothetical protein
MTEELTLLRTIAKEANNSRHPLQFIYPMWKNKPLNEVLNNIADNIENFEPLCFTQEKRGIGPKNKNCIKCPKNKQCNKESNNITILEYGFPRLKNKKFGMINTDFMLEELHYTPDWISIDFKVHDIDDKIISGGHMVVTMKDLVTITPFCFGQEGTKLGPPYDESCDKCQVKDECIKLSFKK